MVYRGHVVQGNVVFDDPAALADGTPVEIHVVADAKATTQPPATRHWLEFSGAIDDLPPDASERIDEVLYGRPRE